MAKQKRYIRGLEPVSDADLEAILRRSTPIREDVLTTMRPGDRAPQLPLMEPMPGTGGGDPAAAVPRLSLAVRARTPQYDVPSFWSKNFEFSAPLCCTFYRRLTIAATYKVPSDKMVVVSGVSFTAAGLQPGEVFQCALRVNGMQRVVFEEMYVGAFSPEPAGNFAFSSPEMPIPVWVPVDHDQTLTVMFQVLGLYPFVPASPTDGFCGNIKALLSGWQAPIQDNRDGGPRPVDQGRMLDVANGLTLGVDGLQSVEDLGRSLAQRFGV